VTIRPRAAAAPVAPDWETEPFEPETVVVPAGTFIMGDDDVAHAAPQHTVDLPAFRIGRYPVTNAQFAEFVWKTGRVAPKELLWDGNEPPEEARDHPVTGITWYEAMDYCAWLSETTGRAYTLPSEAQWEKAARGTDGRAYPWGETWDPARCHTDPEGFAAVDAYPAQSPYGGYDMVGNAREWTTTLWGTSSGAPDDRYAYPWADDGRDDVEAPRTTRRVVRGGRGSDPAAYKCAARRSYFPDRPGPRRNRHGFRVVVYES
jgi:formylglycine-generating enzyme required for sulfatase activity